MIPPNLLTPGDCPESCYPCDESGPGCFNNCIPAPTATISGSEAATSPSAPSIDGTYDITNTDPYPCTDQQTIYEAGGTKIEFFSSQGTVLVGPDLYLRLAASLIYSWSGGACAYSFTYERLILASSGCPTGDVEVTFSARDWAISNDPSCEVGADIDEIATPTMTFNFA